MLDKRKQKKIITDLLSFLKKNKELLFSLNYQTTKDTNFWIEKDFQFIIKYLENYLINNESSNNRVKPKGKILIITSYNEPLILSIIPIINAIFAGNEVYLKPSRKSKKIVRLIWRESGLIDKYNLNLKIKNVQEKGLAGVIKSVVAVYFFGGLQVAKKIAKLCADNFVEFIPEIEASDCQVISFKKDKAIDNKLVNSLLYQSFSHAGQSCQRIQGVYIHQENYEKFKKMIFAELDNLIMNKRIFRYIDANFKVPNIYFQTLIADVKRSKAKKAQIPRNGLPILVDSPQFNSEFIKGAYFYPSLWIKVYRSDKELIKYIKARKFFLGLNILSDKQKLIDELVDKTNYSRYTINISHIDIVDGEGWGGMWPSGYHGYQGWLDHFTNPYICLKKDK